MTQNNPAKNLLLAEGWVEIVDHPGYVTNGREVVSFKKYKEGKQLTWSQGTRGLMMPLTTGSKTRMLSPGALLAAYEAGGVLPPSRVKVANTTRKGCSKYTYFAGSKMVTVRHITARTGLTKETVLGRLKKYGHFVHNGVKFSRK